MKKKFSFIIGFFIVGALIGGLFITSSYSLEERSILEKVSSDLIRVSEEKESKINLYFSDIEESIQTLRESEEVKNLLKQELVFDESVIKIDVDEKARVISKEVENYLRAHPEMSLKDLQENKEFQDIAVQPVGKEGYSFVFDSQSLINYFHKEPQRIGYDYNTMEKTFPELWKMFKETSEKGFSEGFYYRDEPDGSISHKYGRFVQIPVKTADEISMSLGTTAYMNNYKIIKDNSKYLEDFNKEKDYHNLVLVSPEGYMIYMVNEIEDFGTNFEWEVNLEEGLSKNYFKVKESKNISFYGPFIRHYGDIYPKFSVMVPIYESEKLLGYVGLLNEMNEIFRITYEIEELGETGESYLVNEDLLLISPLTLKNFDIMIQSVDTENTQNCFNKTFPGHIHGEEPVTLFLDYGGKEVFGTHREIENISWCLLVEIDEEEVINAPLKSNLKRNLFVLLPSLLILIFIGFFIGRYLDRRDKKRKIRKYPCGIKRKFQPWYCKHLFRGRCSTYPNGRCGAVIKTRNFFTNLKIKYYLLFALIFAVGYFFLITSFFQGWQNARLLDVVPDLIFFIIAFIIFGCAFRYMKNERSRKFLAGGAGLLCLVKLYEIPLQELQAIRTISPFLWYPSMIITVLGFLLILSSFKEVIK